jgi:hypothetical protein
MQQGTCSLCGNAGDLTFEHIPPKAAFNNLRTISLSWDQAMRLGPDAPVRGKIQQGGVGAYSLCPKCNNWTGKVYAPGLIAWCYRGMEILERSNGSPELFQMYQCYPLRILKEILVMFCSVNPQLTNAQPWLRRFLLNEQSREMAPGFRMFVYYNLDGKLRYAGGAGMVDFSTGQLTVISEINYPPLRIRVDHERHVAAGSTACRDHVLPRFSLQRVRATDGPLGGAAYAPHVSR